MVIVTAIVMALLVVENFAVVGVLVSLMVIAWLVVDGVAGRLLLLLLVLLLRLLLLQVAARVVLLLGLLIRGPIRIRVASVDFTISFDSLGLEVGVCGEGVAIAGRCRLCHTPHELSAVAMSMDDSEGWSWERRG